MDNSAAAAYANFGAGRFHALTSLARDFQGFDIQLAALRIKGERFAVASALSRFAP